MIRYEFFNFDVSDKNVHPADIFEEERELAFKFIDNKEIKSNLRSFLFKRYNIAYFQDEKENLIADVNIPKEILNEYFHNSELSQLRASEKYQAQVSELRKNLWQSYVEWIEGRCFRYLESQDNLKVVDVGSRTVGWIEELKKSSILGNLTLSGALPPIKAEENITSDNDVVIAVNVIQREQNPKEFLTSIRDLLKKDGIAVLSFRSGTGFDVLALKGLNKSIFPLDHLFLPSVKGIRALLEESDFEVLEITTPGQLDVEIVRKSIERGQCTDPLIVHLIETVPEEELQTFIQKNNLSSHVRVVARKK